MKVSKCCGSGFPEPGYPDTDLCGLCYEHTEAIDDEKSRIVKVPDIHRRGYIIKKGEMK